jgi:nitroreductase
MDLDSILELIENVRKYEVKDIDDNDIKEILEVSKKTPSAANTQPWEIVLVKENKKELAECTLDPLLREEDSMKQIWIKDAPIILLICIDVKRARARFGSTGENIFAIQDTAVLIHNMRLKAAEKGLASCWVREINPQKIKERFNLPLFVKPVSVLTIGYSPEKVGKKPALDLEDFVYLEKYGEPYGCF